MGFFVLSQRIFGGVFLTANIAFEFMDGFAKVPLKEISARESLITHRTLEDSIEVIS